MLLALLQLLAFESISNSQSNSTLLGLLQLLAFIAISNSQSNSMLLGLLQVLREYKEIIDSL